ncbi:MAG: DUF1499 domain-containing protein [Candidatus Wenzhouxiangella sp. M2_3B_020]
MRMAHLPLLLSLLALIVLLSGGPGYRLDLWGLGFGLRGALQYGLFAGVAAAGLAVALLFMPSQRREHAPKLVAAIVLGLVPVGLFLWLLSTADRHPIHDITTDLDDPPRFEAVRALRADAPNPADYGGEETAAVQREVYPDLDSLETRHSPAMVFDAALATAREQGWEIVAADEDDHRIEATDTTLWYGFKDDVVIRIEPSDGGSRLDIRSKSRVGRSDLGKNAARIRTYLGDLSTRLEDA